MIKSFVYCRQKDLSMLKIRFKNKKYSAVWLVEPSIGIGREKTNQLVVTAPEVADHHLKINVNHEQLELVNLVPDTEVLLNGEALVSPRALFPGDVVTLAGVELEVIDPKDEVRTPPAPKAAAATRATNLRVPKSTGWALKANHPTLQNRVFALRPTNLVGRSSECDIALAAAHLSRRHAELNIVDGVLYVKDLGSANGTFLNGKQVTEARVKRGDELRFDTLSFGVIGPADDLAKTSVRPAKAAAVGATKGPRVDNKPQKPAAVVTAPPKVEEPAQHYGRYSMAILVVLVVIVLAALYLKG